MSTSRAGGRSKRAPAGATGPKQKAKAKSAPVKLASSVRAAACLEKIRALCLALPDTKLTMTWGSPHFRVGDKIFCGFDVEDGKQVLGVKLAMAHAQALVAQDRFWPAKYVGKHGWVSMDVARRESWVEVAALIRESYELIAPKASRAKLR